MNDEKLLIFWGFTEKSNFSGGGGGGGFTKNQKTGGDCLKSAGLDSLPIQGRAWQERGGGGDNPNAHYVIKMLLSIDFS